MAGMPENEESPGEGGQQTALSTDFDYDQATLDGDFGVGLIIETKIHEGVVSVTVKDVVAQGSADREGTIKKGDTLTGVDGHHSENLGKYLKGPSGTSAKIEIAKPSGQKAVVRLERGNAGYWALYDALHKANLDIVSLKREIADAQVAAERANALADLARAETAGAEEGARKECRAKTDLEFKVKGLQLQLEALYKELEHKDEERVQLGTRARKAEGELARAVQETKEVVTELEIERARCQQSLEREARNHKDLIAETHRKRELEIELETAQASLIEALERLERNALKSDAMPKLKARAEDAEGKVQGLMLESETLRTVLAKLTEEMKDLRASEAKFSAMVSAANSEAKKAEYELQLTKPQLERLSMAALEAQAQCEAAKSEARMAQLGLEPLQNRIASLEKDYAAVQAKCDDMAPAVDRERQTKVAVERMLQQTTEINISLARDLSAVQDKVRERDSTIAALESTVKDTEPQLALVPALKAKVLSLASENRDVADQLDEFRSENSRLALKEERAREEISLARGKMEKLQSELSTLQLEDAQKFADMERRINEDVFYVTHERDHYKSELNRYYGLPNPVGVGMNIEETIEKLPTGGTVQSKYVKGLLPGLSADLSGIVRRGDFILSVDGVPTVGMTLDDLRAAISGPRGSKVTIRFLREKAHDGVLEGTEFALVLKRGSWGPEHAVVSPEDLDFQDKGRWPVPAAVSNIEFKIEDINRHNVLSSPLGLQEVAPPPKSAAPGPEKL